MQERFSHNNNNYWDLVAAERRLFLWFKTIFTIYSIYLHFLSTFTTCRMQAYSIPQIAKPFTTAITLPGSKSIALRQLAMSAMSKGTSTLTGVPACDDIDAMCECLTALGAIVERTQGPDNDNVRITGPINLTADVVLNAGMSGASTRLLIGLAALRSGTTHIDGHPSLQVRTNQPLLDVLVRHGCSVESPSAESPSFETQTGRLPLSIRGPIEFPDTIEIDGSISSQYITALLIAATNNTRKQRISITGNLVSRPYINITLAEMQKRGVRAQWIDDSKLEIDTGFYQNNDIKIEGDATAATYFAALATLHAGSVTLTNLGSNTQQGDYEFLEVMQMLGSTIHKEPGTTTITGPTRLASLPSLDLERMPDAALTLIAMAPLIPGETTIAGLSTLHHKECDRLICSARELSALGASVEATESTITVGQTEADGFNEHQVTTYHDHRMAMAFSTLGSFCGGLSVDDKPVVNKTYPHYWEHFETLLSVEH
ncbi:MAG: 3-phosphoshikimate 1-carboxyvinyltransferase [Limisphaerales bacterium]